MTMSSSVSKVTLNGDGVQTAWPFSFKVWKASDLEISITNLAGVTTVVSNWSVSLADPGGTVTYPTAGSPLPLGHKITIKRSMDFLQDVDLISGTRWDPEVVETALDQATAERQQLKERLDRAVVVGVASTSTPEALLASIFDARDTAVDNAASALNSAERAEIASSTVAYYNHEGTLLMGEDTISLPWAYDTEVGVEVFLNGVKQAASSLVFVDQYTVKLDTPVSADTDFEVVATAGARSDFGNMLAASGGAALVGFQQAGTGASARTAQAKLRDFVSVFDFMTPSQIADIKARVAAIDVSADIQKSIDFVSISGGGCVYMPSGTYAIGTTITLPSGVVLKGDGSANTIMFLKSGANCTVIKTINFDVLTGTNSWLVGAEGLPHGFGLVGLQVDGNKANQTSGAGIEIYGKRYLVDDVIVKHSKQVGFYTEAAWKGGQSDWRDMPESRVSGLYIYEAGSHGFIFRGPHDTLIESLFVSKSQGDGVRIESLVDVYGGNCDIGLIHSYANTGIGVYVNALINADVIIGETNAKEGVVFDTQTGIATATTVRAFGNDYSDTSAYYNFRIEGQSQVTNIHILDTYQSAGGLRVRGEQVMLTSVDVYCTKSGHNGVGIFVESGNNTILSANIKGYLGATGKGIKIGATGRNNITTWTDDCTVHVDMQTPGNHNVLCFRGVTAGSEVPFSGSTAFTGTNSIELLFSGTTALQQKWVPTNLVLRPATSDTPVNNSEMVFELTSPTQLTIKARSGGIVRSAVITLS